MKNLIIVLVVLLLAGGALFTVVKVREARVVVTAAAAESAGDFNTAASGYAEALQRLVPVMPVPDINQSKVVSPAIWKKKIEDYIAWLSGASALKKDRAMRTELIDGIVRNEAKLHASKFISKDSTSTLTPEQYLTVWNSAFFGRGVTPDPAHAPLAASCQSKGISIIRLSALTSYTFHISVIDTANNRRTSFNVAPEDRTFILAPPGEYLLLCKSSIRYPGRKIWHSAPVVIPLSVPSHASLITKQLEIRVVRDAEATSAP